MASGHLGRYKTEWCHFQWRRTHNCKHGDRCCYAHSIYDWRGPLDDPWYVEGCRIAWKAGYTVPMVVPDDPWQQVGCHPAAGQLADDAQSLAATSNQWGQAGSWDEPHVMQQGWYPAQAGPAPQADADSDIDPDLLRTLQTDIQAGLQAILKTV